MAIVQTLNFSDFQNTFKSYGRENQFSQAGLEILFDYLEQLSEDTGEDIQMDVIGLCCEYEEATFEEVMDMFPDFFDGADPDEISRYEIENALEQETNVCGIDSYNGIVVFQSF